MEYYSKNETETMLIGEEFGKTAKSGDIFCLSGGLGAGKTVFSKGFARGMDINTQITSPTFTFVNEYEGRLPLYHFDAYRLENAEASVCFDFEEYFENGVCLIEWADNIIEIIPERAFFLTFERIEGKQDERKISIYKRKQKGLSKQ